MQQDIRRSNNRRLLVTHARQKSGNSALCELRFGSLWILRCTSRSFPTDSPPCRAISHKILHGCLSTAAVIDCVGTVRGRCTSRRCCVGWNTLVYEWRIPTVSARMLQAPRSCVPLQIGQNWGVLCGWWRRVDSDWQCVKPCDCSMPLYNTRRWGSVVKPCNSLVTGNWNIETAGGCSCRPICTAHWTLYKGEEFAALTQNCENPPLASSCLYVCPFVCPSAWNKSGRLSGKVYVSLFFENMSRKFKFH
jgi:hypothetical protein